MNRLQKRAATARLKHASLAALAAAGLCATSLPASAIESPLHFGDPIVLSQQGQRLKVLLPFRNNPYERVSAVSFLVDKAEVPEGFKAPDSEKFIIMRPDTSPYVILHSAESLRAPNIMLTVSVAGDPDSPYQIRLEIPAESHFGSSGQMAGGESRRYRGTIGRQGFRRVPVPAIRNDLPPK